MRIEVKASQAFFSLQLKINCSGQHWLFLNIVPPTNLLFTSPVHDLVTVCVSNLLSALGGAFCSPSGSSLHFLTTN